MKNKKIDLSELDDDLIISENNLKSVEEAEEDFKMGRTRRLN